MKHVLMIEDWTEFLITYGLSKKDGDCLIRDYASPGNLLAEFKVKDDAKSNAEFSALSNKILDLLDAGQPVHILILASDEGSEEK